MALAHEMTQGAEDARRTHSALRRLLRAIACGLALGLVIGGAPPAQAQSERAVELIQEAQALLEAEEYEQAADRFIEAFDWSDDPELLYWIGESFFRAGNAAEADFYLQQYVDLAPDGANVREAEQRLDEIAMDFAAPVFVTVTANADGLSVFLNDAPSPDCFTPCELTLMPGQYNLRLEGQGYRPTEREVTIGSEPEQRINFTLVPERRETRTPPAERERERPSEREAATETGRLSVATDFDAGELWVDGELTASLPATTPVPVDPGERAVSIRRGGDEVWSGQLDIAAGETTSIVVVAGEGGRSGGSASGARIAGWSMIGGGAALAAGGALLLSSSQSSFDALAGDVARGVAPSEEAIDNGQSQQLWGNVLVGVGGATAIGGGVLVLIDALRGDDDAADDTAWGVGPGIITWGRSF